MRILFLGILVVAAGLPAYAQSTPIRIAGVQEPPELTGKPKEVKKPTGTQRQFGEMIPELTDGAKAKSARPKLDMFLVQHPDYSDGYFMRAMCDLCTLESQEYASILRDVEKAIFSTHPSSKIETIYEKLTDHYSLRGKLQLLLGRHREALDDLRSGDEDKF